METKSNSYALYRAAKLKEGAAFQDFIMERSARLGMILNNFCSREGQKLGENLLGLEIKRNSAFREWGTLNIDVAEKAQPRDGDYVPSGIMRSDNSWLFGIGDELCFWIFPISLLRHFWNEREKLRLKEYRTATSLGYKLPIEKADKFCARRIDFDWDGTIKRVLNGTQTCEVDLASGEIPPEFQFHLKLTPP